MMTLNNLCPYTNIHTQGKQADIHKYAYMHSDTHICCCFCCRHRRRRRRCRRRRRRRRRLFHVIKHVCLQIL